MRNHMVSMRIVQCAITRRHRFQKVACSSVHTDMPSPRLQKPHFGSRFQKDVYSITENDGFVWTEGRNAKNCCVIKTTRVRMDKAFMS